MSRKISHSLVSGRAGAGTTGGQGLKIDWFKTNLGRLLWRDVSESVLEWYLGGTNYGYCAGGYNNPGGASNVIDKWSLSSDANATDVGDLIASNGNNQKVGNSSTTHGYASAGIRAGVEWYDIIQKWTFASDANAADVANLGAGRSGPAGADSADYGFVQGGKESGDTRVNKIEKFTFASDNNATDVGDITVAREQASGCSSATHGYCVGGYASGESDVIDKFSTVSDGNSSDVGNLAYHVVGPACSSSTTHGYAAGGEDSGASYIDYIQKFSFSSDGNASDIGNLVRVKTIVSCGVTSGSHGYAAGGKVDPSSTSITDIDKYSHSSDGNATDVGDLTLSRYAAAGVQY
jgi:hypothetical protein